MFKQPPTAYITLLPGHTHREPFFQKWSSWATIRDQVKPYRLKCSPLRRIPQDAPLVIFNDIMPTAETLDFLRNRSPATHHLIQTEPPTYIPYQHTAACYDRFSRIYTLRDDLHGPKFQKLLFPNPLKSRSPNSQHRFLTMVVGNKASSHPQELYTHRRRLIEFFEDQPEADFTFYGTGWEHLGYRNYGGPVDDKLATLSNFRFTIAYENGHSMPGYVTEKILDCFCAGSVPIYWGAPNITEYVPADCFIDRTQFPSDQALYEHLLTLDPAPYLTAAKRYLASEKAKLFSEESFINQMTAGIQETLTADLKKAG